MILRSAAVCSLLLGLMPVVASAQYAGAPDGHDSHSVIRPVSHGLWQDYDGGCGCGAKHRHGGLGKGCCGPIGCPYGVGASCGCGGCDKGCNYRIACGLPLAFNRVTRSLDCLFPCRPKLLGCGSGWGGCSPCYDPSCGGGCPKPHFGKRFGLFGGCSKCSASDNCNLDCTCGTPAATFGPPTGIPAPVAPPDSTIDPFQDDLPEPMPTDARRNPAKRSPFAGSPTPARRPHPQASLQQRSTPTATGLRAMPINSRVLPANHSTPAEGSSVRQASAEMDDVIRNYTRAKSESLQPVQPASLESDDLPHNPLR